MKWRSIVKFAWKALSKIKGNGLYYASGVKFLFCFPSASFNGGFPFLALSKSVFSSFRTPYKQQKKVSLIDMEWKSTTLWGKAKHILSDYVASTLHFSWSTHVWTQHIFIKGRRDMILGIHVKALKIQHTCVGHIYRFPRKFLAKVITLSSVIFSVSLDICALWDFEILRWWLQMIATCRKNNQNSRYKKVENKIDYFISLASSQKRSLPPCLHADKSLLFLLHPHLWFLYLTAFKKRKSI